MSVSMPETPRSVSKARDKAAKKWQMRQQEAEALFCLFDGDGNGVLDRDELAGLMRQCFPSACRDSEELIDQAFAEADTDGNGGVDFEEFVAYCWAPQDPRLRFPTCAEHGNLLTERVPPTVDRQQDCGDAGRERRVEGGGRRLPPL